MSQYTEKHIQKLEDIQHIQKNPGMYIGDTSNPTHLLYEILDNALDEMQSGYANQIIIELDTNNFIYSVYDNGRGIPIGVDEKTKLRIPVLISTKLFTSGKFHDKAYNISAGLHGVGLTAVNALSEFLEFHIWRDKKHAYFRFENAKLVEEKIEDYDGNLQGTLVRFKPNAKYFESLEIPVDKVKDRLQFIKLHEDFKDKLIKLVHNKKVVEIQSKLPKQFQNCFAIQFLKDVNKETGESIEVYFTWSKKDFDKYYFGCVNLIPVHQGNHISFVASKIKKVVNTLAQKYKKTINPDDYQYGLRLIVLTRIKERKFTSQTKEKLSTPLKYFEEKFPNFEKKLQKLLEKQYLDFTQYILRKLEEYRKFLDSKKLSKLVESQTHIGGKVNRGLSDVPQLKDCLSENKEGTELFIVEGESAGGTFLQVRDPYKHGVLFLKGKTINAVANQIDKILKNKEVQALIKALGTGARIGKQKEDISKLRYEKIIVSSDADPDGLHIQLLVLTLLAKLTPDVLKSGYVYIADAPLYGATHKKTGEFIPIWSKEEFDKIDENEYFKHRFKGLGEMNPDQIKAVFLDTNKRRLLKIELTDDEIQYLADLMMNAQKKRQLLEEKGYIKKWGE